MVAIAIGAPPVSHHQWRDLPSPETAMKLVTLCHSLVGLALAALPHQGDAQSIRSAISPQARASVGITVSARPLFPVTISDKTVSVSSNMSSRHRYSVLVQPGEGRPFSAHNAQSLGLIGTGILSFASASPAASEFGAQAEQLVLIVPD